MRGGVTFGLFRGKPCLNLLKQLQRNDGGNLDLHDRGRIMHAAGSRVSTPIRPFACRIAAIAQDFVDRTDPEGRAPTRAVAVLVEPLGGLLDAERPGPAVTLAVKAEDKVDEFGFDGIDIETFLDLRATALGLDDAIAKRRRRSVPETLFGGLAHGARDVLAILARGVFVEYADDLTHQLLGGIVACRLGHGNDLNAVFAEPPDAQLHLGAITIEAREGMDTNDIEATLRARCLIEHALEYRPTIVGG